MANSIQRHRSALRNWRGAAYLQALPAGSHVIFPDDIYYGFRTIAQEFLPRWGMESTAVDMADLAPTLMAGLGASLPDADGRSFLP